MATGYSIFSIIIRIWQAYRSFRRTVYFPECENRTFRFSQRHGTGADDYLTKPFDESELLSAIEGRLNRFRNAGDTANQLPPDYPLQPTYDFHQDGLEQFLVDPRQAGNLQSLSVDRKVHVLRKKQYVYLEVDEPTRLYFLKSDTIKTVRANADGKELITGLYHPGDFFGYVPLLEDSDYTDSAVTVSDAELVYIPKADFRQLLLANPAVSQQFIKLLAGRVAEREAQLLGMAYNSLRRQVADTLLNLHEQQASELIQLSQDDLAAVVGTATESLIRTLAEFKGANFIEMTASGGSRISEPDKLRSAKW